MGTVKNWDEKNIAVTGWDERRRKDVEEETGRKREKRKTDTETWLGIHCMCYDTESN